MKTMKVIVACIAVSLLLGCQIVVGPNPRRSCPPSEPPSDYTPLCVGDMRQLVDPRDGSTNLLMIQGYDCRTDGQHVVQEQWHFGTSDEVMSTFFFVSDKGYLTATNLCAYEVDVDWIDQNPFCEQRISHRYPMDGMRWRQIRGEPDSWLRKVEYVGTYWTPAARFHDVYRIAGFDDQGYLVMYAYFAPDIGWIATEDAQGQVEVWLSFVRCNGYEYGEILPAKDPAYGWAKKKADMKRVSPYHNGLKPLVEQ